MKRILFVVGMLFAVSVYGQEKGTNCVTLTREEAFKVLDSILAPYRNNPAATAAFRVYVSPTKDKELLQALHKRYSYLWFMMMAKIPDSCIILEINGTKIGVHKIPLKNG